MTDTPEPAGEGLSPVAGTARRDNEVAPSGLATGDVDLLRPAYRLAVRHLAVLAVPTTLLYVPTAIALFVLFVAAVGSGGRIVNADLALWTDPTGSPPTGVVVAVLLAAAAAAVAGIVALAATSLMVAGLLLGRAVGPGAALRRALRRAPAIAGLGLVAVAAGALIVAASAAAVARTGHVWPGVAVLVVLSFCVFWAAVALPIALLEGGGPLRALGRASASTRQRRRAAAFAVGVGGFIVPGLAVAGLRWAVSPLDGIVHTVLAQVVIGVAGVLVVPFQAATLVVVALNQRSPFGVDLGAAAERVPATGPSSPPRTRAPRVVAALALLPLPGLLYAGYIWLNPLDLTRTSDHVLRDDFGRQPVALHLLGGDRPVELTGPTGGTFGVRVCGTASCHTGSRLHDYRGENIAIKMASVTLPDETIAVAAWSPARGRESTRDRVEWVLRLFRCDAKGCGAGESITRAPIIERGGAGDMYGFGVAATTAAGNGLVLAAVEPSESNRDARLRIIRCADPRCTAPVAITATRLPPHLLGLFSKSLSVTVGRGGRPVVAFEDNHTGGLTLVSCDDAACRHPSVNRSELPPLPRPGGPDPYVDGIDVAVPPDDRPVAAYHDGRTGAARLLRCRAPDCRALDTVTLTAPGLGRPWPALALDRAGHPLLVTYDLARRRLVLITCHDAGCTSRTDVPIAPMEKGPGYVDLVVGHDRRPRVLWIDAPSSLFGTGGPLHLTICQDPRCAA
jgi:hypothetical protein